LGKLKEIVMPDMLIFNILSKIGISIYAIIVIMVMLFIAKLVWTIATNHLKHIGDDVKEVLGKVIELERGFVKMGERVSFLEGKTASRSIRKKVGQK